MDCQPTNNIFSYDPPSLFKDELSWDLTKKLRTHKKTPGLEQAEADDGPINAIDRLLKNLPPLANNKALTTGDYKWELEIRAHKKTVEIEGEVEGPTNAIDRLPQGLPELLKEKRLITRSDTWEVDTCWGSGSDGEASHKSSGGGQEGRDAAALGDKDGFPITLSRASTFGVEEKENEKSSTSGSGDNVWTLDRLREAEVPNGVKICAKCGTSHGTKKPKDEEEEAALQSTRIPVKLEEANETSRKGKEKAIRPSIDDWDDGMDHSYSQNEGNWQYTDHGRNEAGRYSWEHGDRLGRGKPASDAGSEAETEPYIVHGPLRRRQTEYFEGTEVARWEQQRREERSRNEELRRVDMLRREREHRSIGRQERREERQRRREEAVGFAAKRGIRRYGAVQTAWTPAMMPRLPGEGCVELKDLWCVENEVTVDEVESDTDTEDGDIEANWHAHYSSETAPGIPAGVAVYDWAREVDTMMQEEKHRWNKLRMHHERSFPSRTRTRTKTTASEQRKEESHDDTEPSCNQCAEVRAADILPAYGPWQRDRQGIAPSRDCDRECRATVDGVGLGSRRIQVPQGLASLAAVRENGDDDVADGDHSDSESEDGNHGDDGTHEPQREDADMRLEIIPPARPPILNYAPYSACDDVQNEFRGSIAKETTDANEISRINGDLGWKTTYLDHKIELGLLNEYKDHVEDRIESVIKISSMASERQRQKDKEFWEGLYEELEIDQLEVTQGLLDNNGNYGKGVEEYKEMAVVVHKSFVKNMKKPLYSVAWAMHDDEEEDFHSARGDNDTPDS